jgi:hypothetical protein
MTGRACESTLDCVDDLLKLRMRLQRARARRDSQPPFSPDWDAAMAEIEDVSRLVWRHVPVTRRDLAAPLR